MNAETKGDVTKFTVWTGKGRTGTKGEFVRFNANGALKSGSIVSITVNKSTGVALIRMSAQTGSHIRKAIIVKPK